MSSHLLRRSRNWFWMVFGVVPLVAISLLAWFSNFIPASGGTGANQVIGDAADRNHPLPLKQFGERVHASADSDSPVSAPATPEPPPATAPDEVSRQLPKAHWLAGASQEGFTHKLAQLSLVPDKAALDEDMFLPRGTVKEAYGFEGWPAGNGLIAGFRFAISDYDALRTFSVLKDQSRACFHGPSHGHGVVREIELRRADDNAAVSLRLVVGLSTSAAREQLIPVLRATQQDVLQSNALRINQLPVGEVNDHSLFKSGELKRIAFARANIYVHLAADANTNAPVAGLDLLALAAELDRAVDASPRVSTDELALLRPRIAHFELSATELSLVPERENKANVRWQVQQSRTGQFVLDADSNGDLLFDDRTNPSTVRATSAGQYTLRLVVIDDYLLFDWEDRELEFR